MNLLRKILENPIGMIVISCFLIVFNSYPAFVLFGGEVFSIRDSLPFLLTADFSALLIMFGIPFLIIKFVFNKRLENFGLCKPLDLTRAVKLSSFVVLLLIPFLYCRRIHLSRFFVFWPLGKIAFSQLLGDKSYFRFISYKQTCS